MPPPTAGDPWLTGRRFGIVIDAGSSGSRLQIYSWKDPRTIRAPKGSKLAYSLPKVEKGTKNEGSDWLKKVEPGLSSLAENPEDVGDYLRPLLRHALDQIPPSLYHETPIFLLATAGMRLLHPRQQARILQETCRFLDRHSQFKIDGPTDTDPCGSSVRIITGEEEGLFGWIAINYLMDGFTGSSADRTTYGFLDMGGASTQIAFEPKDSDAGKNLIDVRLRLMGGEEIHHKVFVTTWLGYGTNQARERYVGKAITQFEANRDDDDDDDDEVQDPCLPKDLALVELPVHTTAASPHASSRHKLVGTGSFEQCLVATAPLLNKEKPCPDANCLMNGVSVPPIDFSASHFIGISEYWYSSDDIFGLGGAYDFVEYERAAINFCSKEWSEIVRMHEEQREKWPTSGDGQLEKGGKIVDVGVWGPKVEIPRLQMQCFKAAWITNVLHEGLGMPRITDAGGASSGGGKKVEEEAGKKGLGRPTFQSLDAVGDLAISWTLGKMVLEASKEVPALNKHAKPLVDPIDDIEDYEDAPFQPIRPPLLSFAGIEDRINSHLPSALSSENLGFSPVLVLLWLLTLAVLFLVCFPLRRQLRSFFLRTMHSISRRDPYSDLMEEGRIGSTSAPASPTTFFKTPQSFRRLFPSSSRSAANRSLILAPIQSTKPSRSGSSFLSSPRRASPITRTNSLPPTGTSGYMYSPKAGPIPLGSTQYALSRSSSPAPGFNLDDATATLEVSSRSRNGSQMSLASANLAARPAALSRMNSFQHTRDDH